ncbi:MAG: hypothetical protein WCK59_01635 [Candidatus Falkowbacteria bacterium]
MKKSEPTSFADIFKARETKKLVKAPAYSWQDLALRIIKELEVPDVKRSSVFKICRDKPATVIERAINDTKELCKSGEKWKYFFKIIDAPLGVPYTPKTYAKNTRYN